MAKYPIRRYKASTRKPASNDDKLVETLISSNSETQRSIARVADSLNQLVTILKDGDEPVQAPTTQTPPFSNTSPMSTPMNGQSSGNIQILQRLNNLEGQNRQIIDALKVIVNHLRKIR